MFYKLLKILVAPILRKTWLDCVSGLENIPNKGRAIICSNHQSYLDFLLLSSVLNRRVHFLAAEVFFKSKLWWPLVKFTGQIRVNRNSKDKSSVYKEVDALFSREGLLGIFPEGTRSRTGNIQKGYDGIIKFAIKYKAPIIPVGIIGAFDAWPPNQRFPKKHKISINIGRPYNVESNDINEELNHLMRNIASLSGQEYEH